MSLQRLSDQYDFEKKELGSSLSDSVFFFNSQAFLGSRNQLERLVCFEMSKEGQTLSRMWINSIDGQGFSPWRAPFGSIECYEKINTQILNQFVKEVLSSLQSEGINSLDIVHYPNFYDSTNTKLIEESLLFTGFKENPVEANQHIEVDLQEYSSKISYAQRKRLNKCKRAEFNTNIEGKESLKEAYELLTDSRERKGYPVTMGYPEILSMFELHPDKYILFTIRDRDAMIAMAVSIRVSKNIIYNFYHADHRDYGIFSPTVLVVDSVYKYCQKEGIDYIDLGISSVQGVVNEGLKNFKKGLGAIDSAKKKYTWTNQKV